MQVIVTLFGLWLGLTGMVSAETAGRDYVSQYFSALNTFSAEFEQVVTNELGGVLQSAAGRMWISRPGRFRWDYQSPYQQLLLADGKRIWSYDPELEQAVVKPVGEVLDSTPAMLLGGESDPESMFVITATGNAEGLDWYRLVPRDSSDQVSHVRIGFADGEMRQLEFADRMGQSTHLNFKAVKRNQKLAAGLFEFTPPAGVDVLGEN